MKKAKKIIISLFTICVFLLTSQFSAFAAEMNDNWSTNSMVGYGYMTSGGLVLAVQQMLISDSMQAKVPGLTNDGYFGNNTQGAVIQFQKDNGLSPTDGIVGPNTWSKFSNHTFYLGHSGSTQIYETQFYANFTYTHYEKDYYNGYCVKDLFSDNFYLCNSAHYTLRTFIPL